MISPFAIVFSIVTVIVALILPPVFAVAYALKNRKQGILSAWLLGALGFAVPQILIRMPVLQLLSANSGFVAFAQSHMILYGLGLAFTAGLFELAGRYAVALLLRKRLTCRRALAAGLGHGGIEAMFLIACMGFLNNLVYMFLISTGRFDALVAQVAASGVDVSTLETIPQVLAATPAGMFLLAGFERLITMTCHAAMSMLVCYGVRGGRTWRCLRICLGVHTFLDSTACISMFIGRGLSQPVAYTIIYAMLTAVCVVCILTIRELCRRWPSDALQEEVQ